MRKANIAKIKSKLKLDCFLPKEDPRAGLEGISMCINRQSLTLAKTSQIASIRSSGAVIVSPNVSSR